MRRKTILVNVIHHPIERGNVTVTEVPYHRQNLIQLKEQFAPGQNVLVGLNGKQVELDTRRVPSGSEVVFVPAAAGPLAAFFTSAIGSFIGNVFWTLVISYAIAYVGGMLFGQNIRQPKGMKREDDSTQSFGWNPFTTQREGIPKAMCYGTNMHYGNVVARWTDIDGSGDEILYMILDYGGGPVRGKGTNTVYFNDQPSSAFPDVTIQERLGTLNQTCMSGFEKNKLEYRPTNALITNSGDPGVLTWTTPNKFFDDIEYTLEFPRGLWHYQTDGSRVSHGVDVKVEISVRDAGSWTTLMDTTITEEQLSPVYKAYKASVQGFTCVHGKQYDLKITKTSSDESLDRYGDELYLRSVREVVDVAFTRPGRALLGITALATERLSGHINVKWIADDKLVQIYNGTTWTIGFSNNRAWVDLAILTQPVIGGDGITTAFAVERYEGLDPSRIDLARFYEWAEFCADQVSDGAGGLEDRLTCDTIVDYETDVWSLAYEIAEIGRMKLYWQGNVLTGWIDKAETAVLDLVTMDNTMIRSWRSAWAGYGEMAGGVEIFFNDAAEGYERKPWPVANENAGRYTRIVSVEGTGIIGKALATRVGNHILQRNKLIKNVNSTRMFKDALRYELGSVVRLQNNVPDWGASYRVISASSEFSAGWLGINSSHYDSHCGDWAAPSYMLLNALNGTDTWAHNANHTHWFILDLGRNYNISKVRGRSKSSQDPIDINIYVSETNGDWGAAVASGISTWQDTDSWVEIDTTPKEGRFIKVEIITTEDPSHFLVFGSTTGGSHFTIFDVYGALGTVTLDRTCTASAGDIIYVRSYDEVNERVVVNSYTVDSVSGAVVTITETWDVTPIKGNILAIGVAGDIKLRRIVKMRHAPNNYFDVEFETYTATLFDSDDIEPNIDNPDYVWPQPAGQLTKPITRWEVIDLINQMLPPQPDIEIPWLSNCTWTGSGGDTVTWAKRDANEPILFKFRGTTYEITPDSTTDEFIYWDPNYTTQFRHHALVTTALDTGHWLMCRNAAGVAFPHNAVQIQHAGILQAGTITAALGQLADLVVTTGKIASLNVTTLKIANEAVTLGVSAYTDGDAAKGDIQSLGITTTGLPITIIGTVRMKVFDVGVQKYILNIYRDANLIYTTGENHMPTYTVPFYLMVTVAFREVPAADTYTYKLNLGGGDVLAAKRFLYAQEVKK